MIKLIIPIYIGTRGITITLSPLISKPPVNTVISQWLGHNF